MKRKIIQIAGSTQLVSLPRKWALSKGIKKGDELDIKEDGNTLIISTGDSNKENLKKELDISKIETYLKYVLQGMYKKGYDEVILYFSDPEVMTKLQELLHRETIGYEVVFQQKTQCTIRAVAGGFESEFDSMLRRTFRLLNTMAEGINEMVRTKDHSLAKSLRYMESDNNKYASFCRRVINKSGIFDLKKSILMYCVIENLEQIADEYHYLCIYVMDRPYCLNEIGKEVVALFAELTKYLKDSYEAFYNFNIDKITPYFRRRRDIVMKAYEVGESVKSHHEVRILHYIINIAQMINDLLRYKLEIEL